MFLRSIFVQTVFWRALSAGSWVFVSLLTIRLFKKHLSVDHYGLLGVALTILGCLPAFDGGFRTAINRKLLAYTSEDERRLWLGFGLRLYSRFGFVILIAGIGVMLLYSLTPNAAGLRLPRSFYISLGSSAALVVMGYAYLQQLTGLGFQRHSFIIQSAMAWLTLLVLWLALKLGAGAWAFVLSTAIPQVFAIAASVPWIRTIYPQSSTILNFTWSPADRKCFQDVRTESAGLLQMQIWTLLLYSGDAILVGWIWTGSQVAHYVLAANLFAKLKSLLQSADEAVWPLLAAKSGKGEMISDAVRRLNGWLYGAAMAGAAVCIPAFVVEYQGAEWSAGKWLFVLFAARYLVVGLATQSTWWLYGKGHIDTLARFTRRELFVALFLSVFLGRWLGPVGIAWAFLAATAAGTLLPIPLQYAARSGRNGKRILADSWVRAATAGILAGAVAWQLLTITQSWPLTILAAAISTGLPLAAVVIVAVLRAKKSGAVNASSIIQFI